jgi:hypothetical protein
LIVRDAMTPGRTPKILEVGTAVLFGALAAYAVLSTPTWSVIGVRLCVDIGLLAIVLITMVLGRPFTQQYAREQVSAEHDSSAEFLRTNHVITGVWASPSPSWSRQNWRCSTHPICLLVSEFW